MVDVKIRNLGRPGVIYDLPNYDLPIWVHPARGANFPDYLTEDKSKYEIWWTFGWPYETSVMMARLVFSYYFDEFPNLKVICNLGAGVEAIFGDPDLPTGVPISRVVDPRLTRSYS